MAKKIGLLGCGTVGLGVLEILNEREEELEKIIGEKVKVGKILVKDINKDRGIFIEKDIITSNFEDVLGDSNIKIVIEVTGDLERSYDYIKRSLEAGKHVVTANKAVVSKYFEELSELAASKGLAFLYEASVGGGIPVLKTIQEEIALNEGVKVQGILNGTCNYILTRMINENKDYNEILKMAQELGYAEADPTADVEGEDTLRKLRILGTLALQGTIAEEDILLDGISSISVEDIENIKEMDSNIKLIGEAKIIDDGFIAVIQPSIIKNDSYFASVNMAFNSITFDGNNVGELKFYGQGAGKLPTGNAVLKDVLDILKNTYRKGNPLGDKNLKNYNSTFSSKFYLRISDTDNNILGKLENITDTLISKEKSIAIITKDVLLVDLLDIIKLMNIERNKYFIARIMD